MLHREAELNLIRLHVAALVNTAAIGSVSIHSGVIRASVSSV